jgi:acetylornithine deacetylase/succinyl-diaminopimelate desuccinylase-like protein
VGCPVGVKLLIEGEEEIGSPHLEDLLTTNADRLSCDVVITADGPYHADGHPLIIFGVRGFLFLDATISGAPQDLHSGSRVGTAPAPTHELVRALAAMWNKDGPVAIPGFYDDIVRPTSTEGSLAAQLPYRNWAEEEASVDGTLPPPWSRLMFEPNLNIAGLVSGYNGPGVKTVIPRHARAKIDVRLIVNQDPHKVYASLRRFLEQRGVEVSLLAALPRREPPIDTPLAVPFPVQRAIEASWDHSPLLQPRLGGTTPDYVFTRTLSVPSLLVPYAPADMHHHAPNERTRWRRYTAALERQPQSA